MAKKKAIPKKKKPVTVSTVAKKTLTKAKADVRRMLKEVKDRNYAMNMVIIKFCNGKVSNPAKETELVEAFRICISKAPKVKFSNSTDPVIRDFVLLSQTSLLKRRFLVSLLHKDVANLRNVIYDFIIWFNSKNK